jgi:predicted nucleic acid-binding protein
VKIICNATPLINFASISRLDILKSLFTEIVIPQAVYSETVEAGFPNSETILNGIKAGWLKVKPVEEMPESITLELDAGEREVIALALSEQKPRVVLDERRARKVAQELGLNVIGTLGILILAKQNRIITQVKPLLDAMMTEAQYWVNESLYHNVLQAVSEDETETLNN